MGTPKEANEAYICLSIYLSIYAMVTNSTIYAFAAGLVNGCIEPVVGEKRDNYRREEGRKRDKREEKGF